MYKKALDLFGAKNLSSLLDKEGEKALYSPEVLSILRKSVGATDGKLNDDPMSLAHHILQAARNTREGTPGRTTSFSLENPISEKVSSQYMPLEDMLNNIRLKKRLRTKSALIYTMNNPHPAIIAHQLGHSAQKFKLADFLSRSSPLRQGFLPFVPLLFSMWRSDKDKNYSFKDPDWKDAAVTGGVTGLSALDAFLSAKRNIKSELNASGRGMRFLRNAKIGDLPWYKGKLPTDTKVFSEKAVQQAKPLLRGALNTYKKGLRTTSVLAAASVILSSIIGRPLYGSLLGQAANKRDIKRQQGTENKDKDSKQA